MSNENTDRIIIDLCKDKLNIDLKPEAIDCSHRLYAKEGNHKPILVKFTSKNSKNLVYKNKSKLKGSKIVIKEDLTKLRHQLFKETVKKFDKPVWTTDGKILVNINNSIKHVKTFADLG
ncbi:hypothetical protein RI129_004152 [Pyrocoelia pectoralis]|uniref:Uncharacterized protein n=1 Tax=Pyrocoelia pectoralis TaxID=417401 RepID=A0AAN7VF76_9COLE